MSAPDIFRILADTIIRGIGPARAATGALLVAPLLAFGATETATRLGAIPAAPVDVGSRLQLFVDHHLIDRTDGVRLKLHEPQAAGTAIVFDRPWEGVVSAYATVLKDGDRYRMYYRGASDPEYTIAARLRPGEVPVPKHDAVTCLAESQDGKTWTRPNLGLYEFQASRNNNIVWTGEAAGNFSPFLDANPAAGASERYKAVASEKHDGHPMLFGFVSADGIRWRRLEQPLITDGRFDSLNVVFWDPARSQYAAIYRDFRFGVRSIKYANSKDFLTWSAGQWADFGGAPQEHLYTNATVPYFRAPDLYIAMPRRFLPLRTYFPEMAETQRPGVSDAVFMSSRDCIHWNRFEEAFIRPGLEERNWSHRANTPVHGILPTGPDEISIYVEREYTFPSNRIERMTLRTDGFVSVNAGYPGGELVTRPFTFTGAKLVLNYSTAANGVIRIEIQDENGNPIPGFLLEESPLIFGDKIGETVVWNHSKSGTDRSPLARLAGEAIRLRFVMRDADLYSFRFK